MHSTPQARWLCSTSNICAYSSFHHLNQLLLEECWAVCGWVSTLWPCLSQLKVKRESESLPAVVYANDTSTTGKWRNLCSWWYQLQTIGPDFGFQANGLKTWLIVNPGYFSVAMVFFGNTAVNITSEGHPLPGSPTWRREYMWRISYAAKSTSGTEY